MTLTEDTLLGGRVKLRQPAAGFRAALDPVLLAAAIPARPGDTVLEAGCGTGAAFLCLAARVPGLVVRAIERDPALAALAVANAAANGVGAEVTPGDVRDAPPGAAFHHAFANPPYWPGGTASPRRALAQAAHEDGATLADWVGFLARALRHKGHLALVLPAARFAAACAALRAAGCGGVTLLPIQPREGEAAKRCILRARKGGRGPDRILPALVLHRADGRFTEAAEAILRDGAALAPD